MRPIGSSGTSRPGQIGGGLGGSQLEKGITLAVAWRCDTGDSKAISGEISLRHSFASKGSYVLRIGAAGADLWRRASLGRLRTGRTLVGAYVRPLGMRIELQSGYCSSGAYGQQPSPGDSVGLTKAAWGLSPTQSARHIWVVLFLLPVLSVPPAHTATLSDIRHVVIILKENHTFD